MEVTIKLNDKIATSEFKRPEHMTLRHLLEFLYRQQGSEERFQAALDQPLSIGVNDAHRNFDQARLYPDFPHYREGVPAIEGVHDGSPGCVRIDCHLTRKRMIEAKKEK